MDRYEEAMSRCKQWEREHTKGYVIQDMIEFIFPELANEDEKIKRAISYAIAQVKHENGILIDRITEDMALAWLEKQKEQNLEDIEDKAVRKYMKLDKFALANMLAERDKTNAEVIEAFKSIEEQPAEWSEDEMKVLNSIIDDYEKAAKTFCGYDGKLILLKAIRNSECGLLKQGWSEEDEKKLSAVLFSISRFGGEEHLKTKGYKYAEISNWLKSLRPQPHWKPSEEQMQALKQAYSMMNGQAGTDLANLYYDLKKLM